MVVRAPTASSAMLQKFGPEAGARLPDPQSHGTHHLGLSDQPLPARAVRAGGVEKLAEGATPASQITPSCSGNPLLSLCRLWKL